MHDNEEALRAYEDGIPLSAIVNWLRKRWAIIFVCAVLGLGLSVAYHFLSVDKYTARVDFTIPESPLGGPAFVQAISIAFLEREVGANAYVTVTSSTGVISLVSHDLSGDRATTRLTLLKDSVISLRKFLDERAASQYRLIQQDMLEMPDNPTIYSLMNHFRTYVMAQEEKLFDQIDIKNETYFRQGLPLFNLTALGFMAGCAFGLIAALLADFLSGRRKSVL